MKHSPEPWRLDYSSSTITKYVGVAISSESPDQTNRRHISSIGCAEPGPELDRVKANAERMVQSVNALADVANPAAVPNALNFVSRVACGYFIDKRAIEEEAFHHYLQLKADKDRLGGSK